RWSVPSSQLSVARRLGASHLQDDTGHGTRSCRAKCAAVQRHLPAVDAQAGLARLVRLEVDNGPARRLFERQVERALHEAPVLQPLHDGPLTPARAAGLRLT